MTGHASDRGQTTIDFAIGISVFLVAAAFAFAFLPGIITPFSNDSVADPVTANALADDLAGDRLGDPAQPHVLDAAATAEFFSQTDPVDALPVPGFRSVNATLIDDTGSVASVNGTRAAAGPRVPSSGDVTVAWRTVTLDGDRLELRVRVW
jgi:hypothetical protein